MLFLPSCQMSITFQQQCHMREYSRRNELFFYPADKQHSPRVKLE